VLLEACDAPLLLFSPLSVPLLPEGSPSRTNPRPFFSFLSALFRYLFLLHEIQATFLYHTFSPRVDRSRTSAGGVVPLSSFPSLNGPFFLVWRFFSPRCRRLPCWRSFPLRRAGPPPSRKWNWRPELRHEVPPSFFLPSAGAPFFSGSEMTFQDDTAASRSFSPPSFRTKQGFFSRVESLPHNQFCVEIDYTVSF